MGRGAGVERAMRGGSCSACVSESWNEGAASFRQMVSADQSNRLREGRTDSLRRGLWEGGREWNQLSFPWSFPGDEPVGWGSYTSLSPQRWRADIKVTGREQTSHGKV